MPRLLSRDDPDRKLEVQLPVSRETAVPLRSKSLPYMKRSGLNNESRNITILLSYAELTENHIQDILDIDPAQQPSKAEGGRPQFFGGKFLPLIDQAALQ